MRVRLRVILTPERFIQPDQMGRAEDRSVQVLQCNRLPGKNRVNRVWPIPESRRGSTSAGPVGLPGVALLALTALSEQVPLAGRRVHVVD